MYLSFYLRHPVTHFEDLSNELIYEIFEFIDTYDLYETFFDLNIRFRNLCTHPSLPIQINISSLSKSTFQRYYTPVIQPNKHRIHSIHLSNPCAIDFFSSSIENISKCSQLQTLVLDTIEPQCLENLLKSLALLSNLSSLAIPIHHSLNRNTIYHLIFQLPVLNFCKISLKEKGHFGLPVRSMNQQSSPIEYLIIDGECHLMEIDYIISYIPQLRRLSLTLISNYYNPQITGFSTVLNHLTHVFLVLKCRDFNELEPFIKNSFGHVQVLHISFWYGSSYLDADRWEQLILSYMPHLRIFDLQYTYQTVNDNKKDKIREYLVEKFTSPFWLQRKWFFTHDQIAGKYLQGKFYSSEPYR